VSNLLHVSPTQSSVSQAEMQITELLQIIQKLRTARTENWKYLFSSMNIYRSHSSDFHVSKHDTKTLEWKCTWCEVSCKRIFNKYCFSDWIAVYSRDI